MKIYTYRSGHKTLKKVLSITLSLLVLVQMTPAAFVVNTAIAGGVGSLSVTSITGSGTGPYSVSGTWDPTGNQCWTPAQGNQGDAFHYYINVFEDLNSNSEYDSGTDTLLQDITPAPCNGDFSGEVASADRGTGGVWPASGQSPIPSTFNLSAGSHKICSVLFHVNPNGKDKAEGTDCFDNNVIVTPPSCTDGIQNQDETGVDTGGVCTPPAETCSDGIQNQDETGVDTGGVCTPPAETCSDGIQNQDETGIDTGGVCSVPAETCTDGIQNQNETGVDTGGVCALPPVSVDLVITKSVNDSTPDESQTLVYSLTVTNSGPDSASNVVVSDLLPSGVTFVSASSTAGAYASTTGSWTIGSLSNGASVLLDITVTINASTGGITINNTATVDGDESDPTPSNNSDTESVTVNVPTSGPTTYTLDITVTGDGTGEINGDGIVNCTNREGEEEGVCQVTNITSGTTFNLSATSDEGSNFDSSWTVGAGTCTGNATPCQITVTGNTSLTAHFGLNQTTTTTTSGGGGSRRGGGIVLGINNDEPQGQVLGATFEPGLPNTGNGPLDSTETNTLAIIFAGMIALVGLNLASFKALKFEVKSK
jgi:uncharacterized repeat protein (TIGR01451 family)